MKQIANGLLCILLVIWMSGCGSSSSGGTSLHEVTPQTPSVTVTGEVKQQFIQSEESEGNFFDIEVDTIKFVNLEATQQSRVGIIANAFVEGDTIIIIDSSNKGRLYSFTSAGKFIRSIGGVGNGPGEYGRLGGNHIGSREIIIADPITANVLKYDYNGNVINSFRAEEGVPGGIYPFSDSLMVASHGETETSAYKFNVRWLSNGKCVGTALPYTTNLGTVAGQFSRYDNRTASFTCAYNDTIYGIRYNEVTPLATMGLLTEKDFRQFIADNAGTSPSRLKQNEMTSEVLPIMVNAYAISAEKWVLYWQKAQKCFLSILENGKRTDYKISDMRQQKLFAAGLPVTVTNGNLIIAIDPMSFEFMDTAAASWWRSRLAAALPEAANPNQAANLNPILAVCHIKR